jgi:hypothetical protein
MKLLLYIILAVLLDSSASLSNPKPGFTAKSQAKFHESSIPAKATSETCAVISKTNVSGTQSSVSAAATAKPNSIVRQEFFKSATFAAVVVVVIATTTSILFFVDAAHASTTASVDIWSMAFKKAVGGGQAGAWAALVQVSSLMWLRTCMNYQYRYGGTLGTTFEKLWNQGGVGRLYQGFPFAVVQGPLTRFGDAAANVGILALLEPFPELPLPVKTACASIAAGAWRIVLMPVDASKTALQVRGRDGLQELWHQVVLQGPAPLYRGAVAGAAATAVGHWPWFLTYNFLNQQLPAQEDALLNLARSAFVGVCASCVSDCASNSLRVVKTTKQTARLGAESEEELSYGQVVKMILETDGVAGLFGRGLQTRLLTNAIQGAAFSVLWKYFQQAGGVHV